MLTPSQQKWIDHLSDTNQVKILPLDPKAEEKFEKIKSKIQTAIGNDFQILHRGATYLGISGQKEIDVYIPMKEAEIEQEAEKIEKFFGKPKSVYPAERTKFLVDIDGTPIEIMLTNENHPNWERGERLHEILKNNKELLERYRILKETANGLSTREYYRRKNEFMNEVLGMPVE